MGTGSFSGVKLLGRGDDHHPPSSAKVKERVELYLYSPSWTFVACFRVNFTITFTGNASDFYSSGNNFEYRPRYGLF
jgi:hypothetical protein